MGFPRPENVEGLKVIRIDQELWPGLNKKPRQMEEKIQKVHMALIKGSCAVAELAGEIKANIQDPKKNPNGYPQSMLNKALDATQALGWASQQLVKRRKEWIRPHIKGPFKQVCNDSNVFSENLFGGDLTNKSKDIAFK